MAYEYFNSLAQLTVANKDGVDMLSWTIVDKPRAGEKNGPNKDPRAGMSFTAPYSGPVVLTPGLWKGNFSINSETGAIECREATPTNVRCKVRFLGLPDVERAINKGEKPVAVREPKRAEMGRYAIAKLEVASGPWAGLTATCFLNVEPLHLTTSNKGKFTRDFLRLGLGLPQDANIVAKLAEWRGLEGTFGEEWVKVHDELLSHARKVSEGQAKEVRVLINGIGAVSEIYAED